jgi:hypothetical protein
LSQEPLASAVTLFARVAYNIFSTIEQKKGEKNNEKQPFSPVRRVGQVR